MADELDLSAIREAHAVDSRSGRDVYVDLDSLVAEVERLREDLAAQREIADANRDDAFAYRDALKVVEAAESWREAHLSKFGAGGPPEYVPGTEAAAAIRLVRAVDEWRRSRGQ